MSEMSEDSHFGVRKRQVAHSTVKLKGSRLRLRSDAK